jgi:tripartite-type tricarboxylate transporter receptor subunit TctC
VRIFNTTSLLILLLSALDPLSSALAQEATYPSRTIHKVVSCEPGGSADITARIVAQEITSTLGQSVNIDNIAGAGDSRGTETVARAKPKASPCFGPRSHPSPSMCICTKIYLTVFCCIASRSSKIVGPI